MTKNILHPQVLKSKQDDSTKHFIFVKLDQATQMLPSDITRQYQDLFSRVPKPNDFSEITNISR